MHKNDILKIWFFFFNLTIILKMGKKDGNGWYVPVDKFSGHVCIQRLQKTNKYDITSIKVWL